VFDVERPDLPKQVAVLTSAGNVRDVVLREGILYVAAGRRGVAVYALGGGSPVEIASIPAASSAGSLALRGGLLAVSNGGSGVQLIDVVEPADPRELSRFRFPGSFPAGRARLSEKRLLFVAIDLGGLAIADLGNASSPQVLVPRDRKMRITFR
jgi:hypothetical protein